MIAAALLSNEPVTLESSLLEAGHVYKVEAMVNSPGYNSLWDSRFFMVNVEDAQNIDDPGSTLTMRLNTTQVLTYEDFSCTVFAPGANAVAVYENENMVYYFDGEGGLCRFNWRYPQDVYLYASALYGDGDDWTDPAGGWDGTYNGRPLPSTDYWYVINVPEIRQQFTGHFTLIRSK